MIFYVIYCYFGKEKNYLNSNEEDLKTNLKKSINEMNSRREILPETSDHGDDNENINEIKPHPYNLRSKRASKFVEFFKGKKHAANDMSEGETGVEETTDPDVDPLLKNEITQKFAKCNTKYPVLTTPILIAFDTHKSTKRINELVFKANSKFDPFKVNFYSFIVTPSDFKFAKPEFSFQLEKGGQYGIIKLKLFVSADQQSVELKSEATYVKIVRDSKKVYKLILPKESYVNKPITFTSDAEIKSILLTASPRNLNFIYN